LSAGYALLTPARLLYESGQGKQRVELVVVFEHTPVTGLAESKLLLDDPKQVFHFGSDTGLGLLQ